MLCVKAARKNTLADHKTQRKNKENTWLTELQALFLRLEEQSSWIVFNQACLIPIFILSCDDCGSDGHFLLAAPGPPEESHKAMARVQFYGGPSDRKKRRVPACASVREGPSARINVINRQRICWAICTSSNEIHQTRTQSPPTIKSTGILLSSDWSGKLQRGG